MSDHGLHELAAPYALDALDLADERRFESHLATCERCQSELGSFRESAAALALDVELPAPPELLGQRILAAARAERRTVALHRRWAIPAAGFAAAAVAASIGLAIWATSLSHDLNRERSARSAQGQILEVLAAPGARRLPLQGGAAELVLAPTRKAVLVARNLPAAPADRTYEAWVVTGKLARPAGLFRGGAGSKTLLLTDPVPGHATVGVTLEKAGGVAVPTGAMLLRGST